MRTFKHKREKTYGTHNFDLFQIYVCELSDTKGHIYIGMTILPANGFTEIPFVLAQEQILKLIDVLRNSASGILPQSFCRGKGLISRFFGLQFTFQKIDNDKLHGKLIPSVYSSGQYINVKASSLLSCANSLEKLIASA